MKMNPHRSVVTPGFRNVVDTEVMGKEWELRTFSKIIGLRHPMMPSPIPRRKEDTYQSRMSNRLNRITPMESQQRVANPQGAVNSPAGVGGSKKRMPTCNGSDRVIPEAKAC